MSETKNWSVVVLKYVCRLHFIWRILTNSFSLSHTHTHTHIRTHIYTLSHTHNHNLMLFTPLCRLFFGQKKKIFLIFLNLIFCKQSERCDNQRYCPVNLDFRTKPKWFTKVWRDVQKSVKSDWHYIICLTSLLHVDVKTILQNFVFALFPYSFC